MRIPTLAACAASALLLGLCGCQSCVDDGKDDSSKNQAQSRPAASNGERPVLVRPRLIQTPAGHFIIQDSGGPAPAAPPEPAPAAPSASAP